MRKNVWLTMALGIMLPVLFFAVSCSKQVVQTQTEVAPEQEVRSIPEPPPAVEPTPEPVEQQQTEDIARETEEPPFVPEKVHFELDSSNLSEEARGNLRNMADYLKENPEIAVTIEGHCDDRGTDAYNLALGGRRAESVKTYMIDLGVGPDRMNTVSYGEERPIAMGQDETSWAMNRRAEFVTNGE